MIAGASREPRQPSGAGPGSDWDRVTRRRSNCRVTSRCRTRGEPECSYSEAGAGPGRSCHSDSESRRQGTASVWSSHTPRRVPARRPGGAAAVFTHDVHVHPGGRRLVPASRTPRSESSESAAICAASPDPGSRGRAVRVRARATPARRRAGDGPGSPGGARSANRSPGERCLEPRRHWANPGPKSPGSEPGPASPAVIRLAGPGTGIPLTRAKSQPSHEPAVRLAAAALSEGRSRY